MSRTPGLLTAFLLVALLGGCGASGTSKNTGDFKGDEKAVAQVVDDLSRAASKRDAKAICNEVFAPALAGQLRRGSDDCRAIVKEQLKDADVYKLDVKSARVTATTASASVQSQVNGDDDLKTLRFVREGRAWRLAGLG